MNRTTNFYAGPSVLPVDVFEQIQAEMVDYQGSGLSLMETSHRTQIYDDVHNGAVDLIRELFGVPDNYKILFLGGGATMQFGMIPMNFLSADQSCDFTLTGTWSNKAYADAQKFGRVNVIFDGRNNNYTALTDGRSLQIDPKAAYLHMTSNETINGTQWQDWPDTGDVPIICDMSSDILSRPVPIEKFGLIYAGAQKNLGPSGATLVIIRDDMVERCPDSGPVYLNYKTHAQKNSLYNTPPVFPIYAMKLVLERMKKNGGLPAMVEHNRKKAALLYTTFDKSGGFYRCPVNPKYRSEMNVVFRLPSEELEATFVAEATAQKMVGLKGHRSVGGCRASIYNSMTVAGVKNLTDFMADFLRRYG
ncbi:MAG: 3-phosphoserine/phosphohydroxythreonine transaminase [Chloroflexi bacterium]|nr:3-phosphoserine/phosphohydroxythreonine transaminase [Chloroflexota bacterium]